MSARKRLNRILAPRGFVIEKTTPAVLLSASRFTVDFDFLVRHEIHRNAGDFCFVQIGANDGASRADDLIGYVEEFEATGVLVEPQPDVFRRLTDNFAAYPRIRLLEKAVHRDLRSIDMYRFSPERLAERDDLTLWACTNGIASFDRDHVVRHARQLALPEDIIETQPVACVTVDEVLAECPRTPDLLKIDTEGYDGEILDMLDLGRVRPRIIRFEHAHIARARYDALIGKMVAAGYRFLAEGMDTTAYLESDGARSE